MELIQNSSYKFSTFVKFITFITILLISSLIQLNSDWGVLGLSLVIVFTYLFYHPKSFFHPCNLVAAFYFLYVVMPSSINFYLDFIDYEYFLPWGQIIFWDQISKYSLMQIKATFLVLYFSFYFFLNYSENYHQYFVDLRKNNIRNLKPNFIGLFVLYFANLILIFLYIESTGGLSGYLSNYSETFLQGREGNGMLNILVFTLTNISVFCLGLAFYNSRRFKFLILLLTFILIFISAYVGGFKSRLMILFIIFFAPYLMNITISIKKIFLFAILFFVFLYGTTLVRTQGFYAEFQAFFEMLIGYFNAHFLHDMVVETRDLGFFQTTNFFLMKPLQVLGFIGNEVDYDLSIMLTKEFFPEQWYRDTATQQWPLETDLYLNFGGIYLQWAPLIIYSSIISFIYKKAFIENKVEYMLIAILELVRIITTLRWVLLPWDLPIFITQYIIYYFIIKWIVSKNLGTRNLKYS